MSQHARLAPSASDRWIPCPASVPLSEGTEDQESAAAAEGTQAHYILLDQALNDWLLMGTMDVQCEDPEMQAYLQQCFDYVVNRYNEMKGDNKRILIETKVDLHYMTNRHDLFGQADVIIISDLYIDCIDLKYGAGIFVEADGPQTKIYLLGAMCIDMKQTKGEMPWISVRSTIMQPRFPDADGEIFRYEEYEPEDLLSWKDDILLPAAIRTDSPSEPVPGAKQCRFCPIKATCTAVENQVSDLCSVFQPVAAVDGNAFEINIDDPAQLDVARLVAVHDQIPFIEGYLKAVSARLRILIEARDPGVIGKLKLVRSRGTNKWTQEDDTLLLEALTTAPGVIKKSVLTKQAVISAPQALKLQGLKPAQLKKLQSYIVKGEGALAIVPASDPRTDAFPAMPFEAAEVEAPQLSEPVYDWL